MPPRLLAVLALVAATLVSGCSSESLTAVSRPRTSAPAYVALGDSYTSAPLVPTTDQSSSCLRSDHNYPHVLARALKATSFTDVSCSGARTADILTAVGDRAAQLDAVKADTALVTVGIGGNDLGLSSLMFALRISRQQAAKDVAATLPRVRAGVTAVLRAVRARAPHAVVIAVGYPQLLTGPKGCAALPLGEADIALVRSVNRRLNAVIAASARAAGARFLDLWTPSRGHGICSSRPWVNGIVTNKARALALHPFAVEQRAVARLLAAEVRPELG